MADVFPIRAVAIHEAAHAVVTFRLTGNAGGHVSIVRVGERVGVSHDDMTDTFSRSGIEARVCSLYAGGHAQRRFDPSLGDDGCDRDDGTALALLTARGLQELSDALRERSLELVLKHWPEIVAVADELQVLQVLNETEIELIAETAAGDPEANLTLYREAGSDALESWREQFKRSKGGAS